MAEIPKIRAELSEKLSLFRAEVVDDTVVSSCMEDQLPVGFSVTNQMNPIRFFIRGTENWIDFEKSYFELEGEIEGNDGATPPLDAFNSSSFSLSNNFLHNLFSSIHVNINNSPVTFSNVNYPYVSYIQNLLNFNKDYMDTYSDLFLWSKDTAQHMNEYGHSNTGNLGAKARKTWITAGNKVYGILKLQSPVFNIVPYLLNYLDIDITMNRTDNPAFYFMYKNPAATFRFRLDSIILRIRKLKLNETFNTAVAQMFNDGHTVPYPLGNTVVFTKTYSGYGTDIIEDNLFQGKLPSRVVLGIVSNSAYTGTHTENPFFFKHKNLTDIGLFVNGMPHPIPMTQMDFSTGKTHRIYHYMLDSMQSTNPSNSTDAVAISKKEFDGGYTLFSFDMSSDQYGGLNHNALYNDPANVRLHMRFKAGQATDQITLIVYHEVASRMIISQGRQVIVPVR